MAPSPERLRAFFADLAPRVEGDLRTDPLTRALYSTDASIYQLEPVGVVEGNGGNSKQQERSHHESVLLLAPREILDLHGAELAAILAGQHANEPGLALTLLCRPS